MAKKRVRTAWQRTPKIIREAIEEGQLLLRDQEVLIERYKTQRDAADRMAGDLRVLLNEAEHAVKLVTDVDVAKIDVVIPAEPDRVSQYYVVSKNMITPVFGMQPGDKILIARKTTKKEFA